MLWVLAATACGDDAPFEALPEPAETDDSRADAGLIGGAGTAGDFEEHGTRVRFQLGSGTIPAFDAQPWPGLGAADTSGAPLGAPARWPGGDAVFAATMLDGLASLDGFGGMGPVFFHFDGELDPGSLPISEAASTDPDASLFVIDLDTSSASPFTRVPLRFHYAPELRRLAVAPARGFLFKPGIRYVAVATTGLRDPDGLPIGPSEALHALREPGAFGASGERYRALFNALEAQGIPADRVAGLAAFRAQSAVLPEPGPDPMDLQPRTPFVAAAFQGEALETVLGPNRPGDLGLSPNDGFDYTGLGALVQLRLVVPNLRSSEPGRPGHFERDDSGGWLIKRWEPITLTLLLPDRAQLGDAVPLVIYAHSWGRERSDTLSLARALCGHGFAVAALDAPGHGTRLPDADVEGRFTLDAEPDGFGDRIGDPLALHTEGLEGATVEPLDFRDLQQQWALDTRAAVSALRQLAEGTFATLEPGYRDVRLDLSQVAIIGEGIGAVTAMMVAEGDPSVRALVLTGLGDGVEDWLWMPGRRDARGALARRLELGRNLMDGATWPEELGLSPEFGLFRTLVGGAAPGPWASRLRSSDVHILVLRPELDDVVSPLATAAIARILGLDAEDQARQIEAAPLADPEVARLLRRFPAATGRALIERTGFLRYRVSEDGVERLPAPERIDNPVGAMQDAALGFLQGWNRCRTAPGTGCRVGR